MRQPLLYLVHRIPFPPNKGDKVRSYNLLKYLASRHDLLLGTFVDDPADLKYIEELRPYCRELHVARIDPLRARLRSLAALWRGEALTLPYYRDAGLAAWVGDMLTRYDVTRAVVFSSAMAQYVIGRPRLASLVDFVDVDSQKWSQYAAKRPWPWSAVYAREARRLLAFERNVAAAARVSVFVTAAEAELFRTLAPEAAGKVMAVANGVDTGYFRVAAQRPSPYRAGEEAVVFTGAMDYWPNVDAVSWFAEEVLPAVLARRPAVRFHIVGMNPAPAVRALAERPGIVVHGPVADMRPYLQHARVVVAPLRVARGIQNKVLEAMAMERPVVTTAACAGALTAVPGAEIEVANSATAFAYKVVACLDAGSELGHAARQRVECDYNWAANLRPLGEMLDACLPFAPDGADATPIEAPRAWATLP